MILVLFFQQDVSFIKQDILFRDEFPPKSFHVFFSFSEPSGPMKMTFDPPQWEISPIRCVFFSDFHVCWTHRPFFLVAEGSWQIFTCLNCLSFSEMGLWYESTVEQRIDSWRFFCSHHLSKLHQSAIRQTLVDVPNLLLIEGWTSWSWCQWTANVFKMIRVYLEHLRGAKWMVRGAHSPPLRVILAPLRWCWYVMFF